MIINITNIAIIERTEKGDEKTALDFFDPKSVRASMGALFHINIEHFPLIEDYVNTFPKHKKYCFFVKYYLICLIYILNSNYPFHS